MVEAEHKRDIRFSMNEILQSLCFKFISKKDSHEQKIRPENFHYILNMRNENQINIEKLLLHWPTLLSLKAFHPIRFFNSKQDRKSRLVNCQSHV